MEKLGELYKLLKKYKSAAVAFSAGVDSTFLAYIAGEIFGEKCLLLTVSSALVPDREIREAISIAKKMGLRHKVIKSDIIRIPEFFKNSGDRCYICKKNMFGLIKKIAYAQKCEIILEGSNVDDRKDYRPGIRALKELGIISPLMDSGFNKREIRDKSLEIGLETALKPSYACLASRIPYFENITSKKLEKVEIAENEIYKIGFKKFRVRCRGEFASIEVSPEEMDTAWSKKEVLNKICRNAGFLYVSIDTRGYRSGSLNESLQ